MKDIVKFSLVLCLICVISGGMLALIHDIAEPRIIQQRKLEEQRAIKEVLPLEPFVVEKIDREDFVFYKAKDQDGNLIAYVIIGQSRGYSSDISLVVSLTPKGKIIAVKVLQQRETPGLGNRITEEEFLNQFKDKDPNEQFDTITGATISSRAVIDLIKEKAQEVLGYGE